MVKKKDKTLFAFVTTFLSIVGFIIALLAWKKDKYVMHYAKISLAVYVYSSFRDDYKCRTEYYCFCNMAS